MAEHLARDTGLRPEDVTDDIKPTGGDAVALHLAADTGVDEDEVSSNAGDNAHTAIGRLPLD